MKEGPLSVRIWAFCIFLASLWSLFENHIIFFFPSFDWVHPFSYIAISLFISSQIFSMWTVITPYYFPKCTDKRNVFECQEICVELADTAHVYFALYLTVQYNNVTVNLFRCTVQNILMKINKTKSLYPWWSLQFWLNLFTTLSGTHFRNYFSAVRETIILYGMGNRCWFCTR